MFTIRLDMAMSLFLLLNHQPHLAALLQQLHPMATMGNLLLAICLQVLVDFLPLPGGNLVVMGVLPLPKVAVVGVTLAAMVEATGKIYH